jgi:hypothetical protein
MNGPGSTGRAGPGQEYAGKHRRDGGLGLPGPVAWGSSRPKADGRPAAGIAPTPGPGSPAAPGFRPETAPLADAS